MPFLHDSVLDAALAYIDDNCTVLHVCSQLPADLTEAGTTYTLGNKTPPTIGVPENGDVNGRKVVVSAIADGTVTASGTASHWALVSGTELLAAEALSAPQVVTSGNVFTLAAFDVTLPDPA